jgi:hypothetical protein
VGIAEDRQKLVESMRVQGYITLAEAAETAGRRPTDAFHRYMAERKVPFIVLPTAGTEQRSRRMYFRASVEKLPPNRLNGAAPVEKPAGTLFDVFGKEDAGRHEELMKGLEVIDKGILDVKRAAEEVRSMTADLVRRMEALELAVAGDRLTRPDGAKEGVVT